MNFKKLLQFQQAVGKISKDSTNPFYKSKYFDINKLLEEVKPILNELGLVLVQALSHINGKPAIKTELYDVDNTEQFPLLSSTTPLPENTDPQKMGSTITYYRRYAIQTLLCLQADDDDGNLASKQQVKQEVKTDTTLDEIKKLGKDNGFTGKTMEEFGLFVFSKTSYTLETKNYNSIIEKLKENLIK